MEISIKGGAMELASFVKSLQDQSVTTDSETTDAQLKARKEALSSIKATPDLPLG